MSLGYHEAGNLVPYHKQSYDATPDCPSERCTQVTQSQGIAGGLVTRQLPFIGLDNLDTLMTDQTFFLIKADFLIRSHTTSP